MTDKKAYLELIDKIREHDRLYYVEHRPVISDYEYDQLLKALEEIEKQRPEWVTASSPTQRVSEMAGKGFAQVVHATPMLSLANTYNQAELEEFVERVYKLAGRRDVFFCAELKMDGVAVSVRYERGIYTRALTRGDGRKGEDITANMKTLSCLPLELHGKQLPDTLEVRAEVFMRHQVFQKWNRIKEEQGEEPWANPRNAAAGSLKLLDAAEVRKRQLSAVFYSIAENSAKNVRSQYSSHEFLKSLGLPIFTDKQRVLCKNLEEILAFAARIEQQRDEFDFDIDGIVVKVDDLALQEELSSTGKSPRWAVAYKFAPEQAVTKIHEITLQVGRTGVITPVAELEPVFLAGSTIARATLHNEQEIAKKDIRINDTVLIEKGGDVIPKVVKVLVEKRPKGSLPWQMPEVCPNCQSRLQRIPGEVAVRCPNPHCGDQILRRIIFFASKDAMDIEHMGPKVVEQLLDKGLIKTVADIYTLDAQKLSLLEGFKDKSIRNLLDSIEKSKKTTLSRLILALGIKYVGAGTADVLAAKAQNLNALSKMSVEELLQIEGIGEKMALSIVEFFQNPVHLQEIAQLFLLGVEAEQTQKKLVKGHLFAGKSFVLTGTLSKYSRSEAAEFIQERGGHISSSVSKKTDYLIVGESPGSKFDKAKEFGVAILSEEEFVKLLD